MSNRQKLLIKEGLDKFLAQPTHDLDKIYAAFIFYLQKFKNVWEFKSMLLPVS